MKVHATASVILALEIMEANIHYLIIVAEELNDEYIDNEADDEYDYSDSFINDGPIVDEPTEDDLSDSD
ncbi:hypothetical protein Tco_0109420 [Tanacetum coccineum]